MSDNKLTKAEKAIYKVGELNNLTAQLRKLGRTAGLNQSIPDIYGERRKDAKPTQDSH